MQLKRYLPLLLFGLFIQVLPSFAATPVGFEALDNGSVWHIWNNIDEYFFNATSGIQFTNHYDEYWTHSVFCAGYKDGSEQWQYDCNDQLPFSWSYSTDNATYVNITGWRDKVISGRTVRLAVRYHLKPNDKNMSIFIYAENIGALDIPNDIGFAWRVNKIQIGADQENDQILINDTTYQLNETHNRGFTNMSKAYIDVWANSTCWDTCNETYDNVTFCDKTCTVYENKTMYLPKYTMFDENLGKFLILGWNPNLNYKVNMTSTSQYNTPVTLMINAGPLAVGQKKSTRLEWIDADLTIRPNGDIQTGWFEIGDGTHSDAIDEISIDTADYVFVDSDAKVDEWAFDNCSSEVLNVTSLSIQFYAFRGFLGEVIDGDVDWTVNGGSSYSSIKTFAFPISAAYRILTWEGLSMNKTACDNLQVRITSNEVTSGTNNFHRVYQAFVNMTYTSDSPPKYTVGSNATNTTVTGEPIEHSLHWTGGGGDLSGYIFSFDNGTGTFLNDSWVPMTGSGNWSNVTKIVNYTAGSTIRWKVYTNNSLTYWNVSLDHTYQVEELYKTLHIEWHSGSDINSTTCPSGSPCYATPNSLIDVNVTITCEASFGYDCKNISVGLIHTTTATYEYINTSQGATPFFLILVQNGSDVIFNQKIMNFSGDDVDANETHIFELYSENVTTHFARKYFMNGTYISNISLPSEVIPGNGFTFNGTVFSYLTISSVVKHINYDDGSSEGQFSASEAAVATSLSSNDTHYFTVKYSAATVYRYLANGNHDGFTFNTSPQIGSNFQDLTFDGTYFWISRDSPNKVFRYLANGTYDNFYFSTSGIPSRLASTPTAILIVETGDLNEYVPVDYFENLNNPYTISSLGRGESFQVNHTINITAGPGNFSKIKFNVSSTDSLIADNSTGDAYINITEFYKRLLITWHASSELDSVSCSSSSPCQFNPNSAYNISATVICDTFPGYSCENISIGLIYNTTATTYEFINTSQGATPFSTVLIPEGTGAAFDHKITDLSVWRIDANDSYLFSASYAISTIFTKKYYLNGTEFSNFANSGLGLTGFTYNGNKFSYIRGTSSTVSHYTYAGASSGSFTATEAGSTLIALSSNATHYFVVGTNSEIYYYLSNGTYDNFNFSSSAETGSSLIDLTFDYPYLWVLDSFPGRVYRYLADGTYDNYYFDTLISNPKSIASTNTSILVLESTALNEFLKYDIIKNDKNPLVPFTLNNGESFQFNLTINATGALGDIFKLKVNASAVDVDPPYNSTGDAYVYVTDAAPDYIAIALTPVLGAGLTFGSLEPDTGNTSSDNCGSYGCNITVSADTTVNVSLVVKMATPLTRWGGAETIGTQYWNSSAAIQPGNPAFSFQTSYDYTNLAGSNLTNGTNLIFNSWVSVPLGKTAGLYNNTIYFCATKEGTFNC
ncbi:MAG: hypothetical protein GOV00_00535 [Candidatus Altiarchaeota archaeon]|nr:hypothetical protein [Candidatus Altiarchaeota archaeon]